MSTEQNASSAEQNHIRLLVNYFPIGWHEAIWHGRADAARLTTHYQEFRELALQAEAARLDGLFLADQIGGLHSRSYRSLYHALDPTVHLAAVAEATRNIGLVSTVSGVFGNPGEVARKIASLNHISGGRTAWNIVTSQSDTTREVFGAAEAYSEEDRYARAHEFAEVVHAFWESLPEEAFVADESTGIYLDSGKTRPVDHRGRFFQVGGTLPLTPGPDGRPLIFQAGASERGIDYGVRWADAIFTAQRDAERAQGFYRTVHDKSAAAGKRAPLVLPGVFIYPGATEEEARRHKRELDEKVSVEIDLPILAGRLGIEPDELPLDAPLPYELLEQRRRESRDTGFNRVTGLPEQVIDEARRNDWTARDVILNNGLGVHRVLVGAGEQIAQNFLDWVDARGADGFVLSFGDYAHDFPIFAETVLPYLQERGRFRTEYDAERTTLRQNLRVG